MKNSFKYESTNKQHKLTLKEENKNSYSKREIRDAIDKVTDHTLDFDYAELLHELVERAIDDNGDVSQAIDEGMIYYTDQWTAYRYFCDPGDDIDIMWEGLYNDVSNTLYFLGFNSENE